jgi:hypothetical protein
MNTSVGNRPPLFGCVTIMLTVNPAGVVADSVPELEWKETEAKARALLRAAELVEEGLE